MEAMEHPVTESRSERITRYKAERRRELAELYGNVVELPTKWVRRDGKEVEDPASQAQRGTVSSGEGVNGRKREVVNGEVDAPADPNRGQGSQDSACMLIGEEHDAPQLHTGVSVGRLRSALLQQTTSGAQPDKACPDAGRATSSLDLAVQLGSEGGRRRTRRYLPGGPGGGRKTSERFRTQPITANEVEESSGLLDAKEEENHNADVKTDARAKMSVAAKMSLFKELEKSAEPQALALLKPLPGSVCHERKVRRGNDHRFMTQPITSEEMVAISTPKAVPPVESQCVQAESADDVDESCKLSMSEKLALFNKLSLPGQKGPADGPPERRRLKGARYRTQPITVEEVNLLQKGPVQLPAFSLSPHLSDRQQASSVNLKPSEVRLSQPRPDPGPVPGEVGSPTQQVQQRRDSEPGLRGILKKSCSGVSEWNRMVDQKDSPSSHEQNGRSCEDAVTQKRMERMEQQDFSVPPRRERRPPSGSEGGSLTAAPWRQRARARRETIACTPVGASSEQEEGNSWSKVQDHLVPSVEHNGTVQRQQNLDESVRKTKQESALTGHIHVSLIDNTVLPQEENSSSRNQEETLCVDRVDPQCWEPVFASVYSSSTPQYVMCFNQTNLSFEAQEVPSPTGNLVQPQRQKTKAIDNELHTDEAEGTDNRGLESLASHGNDASRDSTEAPTHTHGVSRSPPLSVAPQEVKQETPVDDAGDRSPSSACVPPQPPLPCGGVPAIETQHDLGVLCQTNAPMLSSAVAVHRRSVRPSRRTQGSRNPLRALAARDDITQDYMGDRVNLASEERIQTEKKCKNSSGSHPTRSEGVTSSSDAATSGSYPPFGSLMLLHIKGRRQVQVHLVEPSVRSLNSGDCFLLVTPEHCIVWRGEFANEQERQKASELASAIQSRRDLGCQASEIILLEEGVNCDGSMATDFWRLLGGRTQYRGASEEEEDELYERGVVGSNCVYRLLENRLVPVEQAWASSPSVSLLGFSEVLVFDFGSEVYLWHGQDVSPSRRSVALQLIHQLWAGAYDYSNCRVNPLDPTQCNPNMPLRGEGRPSWALLGCVSEHKETILFKEKFLDWSSRTGGGEDGSPAQSAPVQSSQSASSSSHLPSACDAKVLASGHFLEGDGLVHNVLAGVDIGRGHGAVTLDDGRRMELQTCSVKMWHVQEFDDWEIPAESSGQLHEGDAYLIRWTYRLNAVEKVNSPEDGSREPNKTTALFLWRGRHCSVSRRDTAAFVSIGMTGRDESQVVVPQGNEPPCFLQLFHGGLVIHKSKRDKVPNAAEWRLFCVRGELPEEGSLLEVEPCCASLRSRGSVVLLNSQEGVLFLWVGCKAHTSSREVGRRAVECLTQNRPPELGLSQSKLVEVQEVEEGTEPAEFWTALGHMDRKAYDCMLQDPGKFNFTPRLFHLSSISGTSQAEELQSPMRLPGVVMSMPFVQECLYSVPQPALFLLDNHLEVYLWQSGQAEHADPSWLDERRRAVQTTLHYCKEINSRRPLQAYLICEGSEPLTFTNTFPRWEQSLGALTQSDAGQVKLTLVQDALAQLMKTQYPLEELLQSPLPEGVDPQHLEVYLSDEDFQTILEMKRDEYASLPSWKQIELKRRKGLLC